MRILNINAGRVRVYAMKTNWRFVRDCRSSARGDAGRYIPVRLVARVLFVAACIALVGCGGEFGESIRVSPEKYHRVTEQPAAGLSFPADEPYVIAESQRFASGEATAESQANRGGSALCKVATTGPGTAWSEFQLGHVIQNDSAIEKLMSIQFDVEYSYALERSGSTLRSPEDVALKVYISDTNKHVLHRSQVFGQADYHAPDQSSGAETVTFELKLDPHQAYQLVLAGRVEVKHAADDAPISTEINVKRLTVTARPN